MDNLALYSTAIFSALTLILSYGAFVHTRERFRLDLFEKRWGIYERTLEFCSVVMKHGSIPKHGTDESRNEEIVAALIAAHESFRGIGHHKALSLFGPDIHEYFDKLNNAYAWLITGDKESYMGIFDQEHAKQLNVICRSIDELPDLFKPYMYFGDYKKGE